MQRRSPSLAQGELKAEASGGGSVQRLTDGVEIRCSRPSISTHESVLRAALAIHSTTVGQLE